MINKSIQPRPIKKQREAIGFKSRSGADFHLGYAEWSRIRDSFALKMNGAPDLQRNDA